MKYLAIICAILAIIFGVYAYYLDSRLSYTREKLTLAESQKNALETEVREYNEKSLQASKQIGELRKEIQKHKEDDSDGYRCLSVAIPDDIAQFLRNL